MTVALESGAPAGWWMRARAFGIDVVCPSIVVMVALLTGWSAPRGGWLWWVCMVLGAAVVLAMGANRLLLPAVTGSSLGRSVVGIAVVDGDDERPGPWRLLLRDIAHVVDTVPFALGWLWPLIDTQGRTFADLLVRTEVHRTADKRTDARRVVAAVLVATAALSALGALAAYATVYRPQQALIAARNQIGEDGPKLVTEMLSYTVKTAPDDFAHAQTLVTDDYRPTLTQQQEAVRNTGLVDNDYWVSNSAVLSASGDHATMLLLLQGQRGVPPGQRFVTASVRADYARVGGQWKVANLTVLAQPKRPAPPQDSSPPAADKPAPAKPAPAKPPPAKPAPPPAKPAPPKPSGGGR